jgi:two-component system LytT family response regulator
LDYLLKPIDDDRFVEALKRAQMMIRQEKMGDVAQRLNALLAERSGESRFAEVARYTERLAIREGSRIRFVLANEIEWVEAAGDYVIVHTAKQTHLLRETLTALEKRLDPNRFLRIHRSTIVKTSRIVELDALPNREYLVRMADGKQLRSSRTYQDRLAHWLP